MIIFETVYMRGKIHLQLILLHNFRAQFRTQSELISEKDWGQNPRSGGRISTGYLPSEGVLRIDFPSRMGAGASLSPLVGTGRRLVAADLVVGPPPAATLLPVPTNGESDAPATSLKIHSEDSSGGRVLETGIF